MYKYTTGYSMKASMVDRHSTARSTTTTGTTGTTRSTMYDDFDDGDIENDHECDSSIVLPERIQRFIQPLLMDASSSNHHDHNDNDDKYDDDDDDNEIRISSTGQIINRNQQKYCHHHPVSSFLTLTTENSNQNKSTTMIQNQYKTTTIVITTSFIVTMIITSGVALWYHFYYRSYRPKHQYGKLLLSSSSTSNTKSKRISSKQQQQQQQQQQSIIGTPIYPAITTMTTTPTKFVDNDVCNHCESDSDNINNNNNTIVPHLIPDETIDDDNDGVHHNKTSITTPEIVQSGTQMMITVGNSTPLLDFHQQQSQQEHILTLPRSSMLQSTTTTTAAVTTPHDTADHVVTLVSALQEKCRLHNIEYDAKIAWQWAIRQQTSDQMIQAQERMDVRHMMYHHTQQTIDRTIQHQYHHETIHANREDKDWLQKLNTIRDKCYDTILHTIVQCLFGTFMIVIVQPIIYMVRILYSNNSSSSSSSSSNTHTATTMIRSLLCYNTGTLYDPIITTIQQQQLTSSLLYDNYSASSSSLSWYDRYTSITNLLMYMDSYIAAKTTTIGSTGTGSSIIMSIGDMATCAVYTTGRIFVLLTMILIICLTCWLVRQLIGGSSSWAVRVQQLCKSMFLIWILHIYNWIPKCHLYRMIFCLSIVLSICYSTITYRYYTIRHKFLYNNRTTGSDNNNHHHTTSSLPQISDVNECMVWFDDMIQNMQMIPIIALGGLLLILLQSTMT